MSWNLVAEVSPGFDWEAIDVPIFGNTSFKIEHSWGASYDFPGAGFAWLCQVFPDGSRRGFKRLWPYRDPRIVTMTAPDDLAVDGWDIYQLQVKRSYRAQIYGDANWRVRIYEWAGSEPPPLEPDPGAGDNTDPDLLDLTYDGGET